MKPMKKFSHKIFFFMFENMPNIFPPYDQTQNGNQIFFIQMFPTWILLCLFMKPIKKFGQWKYFFSCVKKCQTLFSLIHVIPNGNQTFCGRIKIFWVRVLKKKKRFFFFLFAQENFCFLHYNQLFFLLLSSVKKYENFFYLWKHVK